MALVLNNWKEINTVNKHIKATFRRQNCVLYGDNYSQLLTYTPFLSYKKEKNEAYAHDFVLNNVILMILRMFLFQFVKYSG